MVRATAKYRSRYSATVSTEHTVPLRTRVACEEALERLRLKRLESWDVRIRREGERTAR